MTLLIAGDIGGTNTTLRLVRAIESPQSIETIFQKRYPSGSFPDLVPIVKQFLTDAGEKALQVACFAIAGPVVNNTCELTNLKWSLNNQRLEKELGIEKVSLINDFAAVSHGILGLPETELDTLQPGKPERDGVIGILGAGTGLGESFLIPSGSDYRVCATEGGHADFAPRSALEFELLEYLKSLHKTDRISVERVVSGRGIVAIYKFLRDRGDIAESPEIAKVVRSNEPDPDPAAVIAQAALESTDSLCQKTMEIFVEAYGAEAGNLSLKLLPYGGLYVAGGIAPKILPLLQDGRFLAAFKHKGRMSPLLEQMPVRVVLNSQVGLLGAVLYALKTR
jgi:glucokinase